MEKIRTPVKGRTWGEPQDDELLRLLSMGDTEAFRVAFRRHAPHVHAIALSVMRDRGLAEDVVQETFFALLDRAADLDLSRGSLAAWLHTVAHRRAIDRVRREEVRRSATERAMSRERVELGSPDPADKVVEGLTSFEDRARARAALASLPDAQRDVVERMYFGGQTGTQIARDLDVPLGTVKSRVRLAMRRLRADLLPVAAR